MVDVTALRTLLETNNTGRNKGPLDNTPAVPASGTPVSNDFGFNVMVRLAGGTVTAVAIDGTAITGATTNEWYPLRSKSTITVTWNTTAPTWQWLAA